MTFVDGDYHDGGAQRRLIMGLILRGSQDLNHMLMLWLGHQERWLLMIEIDLALRGRLLV